MTTKPKITMEDVQTVAEAAQEVEEHKGLFKKLAKLVKKLFSRGK